MQRLGLWSEDPHAIAAADDYLFRQAEKKTVFDRADDVIEMMRDFLRIRDRPKSTIHDVIAAIGDEGLFINAQPQRGIAADLRQMKAGRLPAKTHNFNGYCDERAKPFNQLGFVRDDHQALGCRRDDLLPQQRAPVTLNQRKRPEFDLIGPIYGEVQLRALGKARQRNAQVPRVRGRLLGRWNAGDAQAISGDLAPERADEIGSRRSRS